MKPKVSIIVPIYNVERYLKKCIDSIIKQTLSEIEIICVNDGSTDSSSSVLQKYAAQDSRIVLIQKENGGYSSALNAGLDKATGEYIGIVESDDFIDPEMFQILYETAGRYGHSVDIVKAAYWEYWEDDGVPQKKEAEIAKMPAPNGAFSVYQYSDILCYHPSTVTAIYRHDFLESNNIRYVAAPGAAWTDNPFFFATMCLAKSIAWIPRCLYFYRQDNLSSSSHLKDCSIPFRRLAEMFDFTEQNNVTDTKILKCLYKRVFIYLRNVLNSPHYNPLIDRPYIENVMKRMSVDIMKDKSFHDLDRKNHERFKNKKNISSHAKSGNIKISVIVPVYNVQPFLRQCLDSIVSQSLKDIEVICIDDGSTDYSRVVLQEYRDDDERIQILFQENCGAGVARNKGLRLAAGQYLSILDADDFFESDMLEKAYCKALKYNSEIVMFRFHRYDHIKQTRYDLPHMMRKDKFPNKDTFSIGEVEGNFYYSIYGWTWDKIFSRAFIEKLQLQFQGTRIYNDMFFTYSALASAERISYLEDALVCQRVNRTGAISKSVQNNWFCIIEALNEVKNYLLQINLYNQFETAYVTYALHMLLFTLQQTNGTAQFAMKVVLKEYALKILNLDLSKKSLFENADEYQKMKDAISIPFDAGIFQPSSTVDTMKQKKLLQDITTLKNEISSIHASKSFRLGSALTYIPRKIRGGIRCLKEHGVKYTLRRVREKFCRK